jgi:hypothetical protein
MTSLRDRAEGGSSPEIVLAADQPHRPEAEILEDELVPADDITPEGDFPEYGSFLRVRVGGSEEWWETPQSFAEEVIEVAEAFECDVAGLRINVAEVLKAASGEWQYSIQGKRPGED